MTASENKVLLSVMLSLLSDIKRFVLENTAGKGTLKH